MLLREQVPLQIEHVAFAWLRSISNLLINKKVKVKILGKKERNLRWLFFARFAAANRMKKLSYRRGKTCSVVLFLESIPGINEGSEELMETGWH